MKYMLRIEDRKELVILEYRNVELISKDKYMAKMRFTLDPEYSVNEDHPDYVEFSVFPDGAVNKYDYEWQEADDIFEAQYNCEGFATWQLLECKKMGA